MKGILGLILLALAVVLVWAGFKDKDPWQAVQGFLGGDPNAFSEQREPAAGGFTRPRPER